MKPRPARSRTRLSLIGVPSNSKPSMSFARGSLAIVNWYLIERAPLLRDLRLEQIVGEALRSVLAFERRGEGLVVSVPHPNRFVVCFDESPTQLIGEAREPIAGAPGQPDRYDCEYRRNGTANLFVFLDTNRPWRKVKVTERRTAIDFAVCMREL